ncbi:MAG: ACP S-malonyltransferase [Clostridiales Family XIII bacterium]|jgi:[acyl-carrier-protein] S-malonyltransferase|nr:ACP S-malonyltransferase [Clostridiales Family XIII bacterium]
MVKIAAVFAGQGAQYPGMGKSLCESSAAARAVFEAAGDKVMRDCFEATQDELNQTDVTQPAVYTVDMAAWAAFEEAIGGEIEIVGMAGFSLGEYAAFTAAGVIPGVRHGIALIKERGRLMAAAGKHHDGTPRGAMAAVLGAKDDIVELVERARGQWVLEAVNFNAPTQTVIAGDAEAIEAFSAAAKASGKKLRVMPLPVSTAFHSPIMAAASDGIRAAAAKLPFGEPKHEVYLNMTAGTLTEYIGNGLGNGFGDGMDGDDSAGIVIGVELAGIIPRVMAEQVKSPVRWQETIEALAAAGAEAIVEFGPGKTLTGLAKKTAPNIPALNVQDVDSLTAAAGQLSKSHDSIKSQIKSWQERVLK